MSEPLDSSVLRRMLKAPANQLDQSDMSPAKALQTAIIRGSENLAGLAVEVSEFAEKRLSLADLVLTLEDPHLIQLITGPGGAVGLALWNPSAVTALTEHLITGRIAATPPGAHVPTRTDAAVITSLLRGYLELFDQGLTQVGNVPPVAGFRPSDFIENGRAVSMSFEDISYRKYKISLDFGNGAKTGELSLIYPWEKKAGTLKPKNNTTSWQKNLRKNVSGSRVDVEAILHHFSMPLDEVEKFEVGTVIPVPVETIGKVSVEGNDHKGIAVGRLGQCNGFRAVRIVSGALIGDQEPCDFSEARPRSAVAASPGGGTSDDTVPSLAENAPNVPTTSPELATENFSDAE